MIRIYVILFLLIFDLNFKSIYSQIINNKIRKKNVIDLYDGSGNDQENRTSYPTNKLLTLDDEDSLSNSKNVQSSGDGPIQPPDVYPSLDPYTKTRSTATILVDIAIEEEFKSYMLHGSKAKSKLKAFHDEIIKNLKEELKCINVDLSFDILSLRPGPLIPKKSLANFNKLGNPSVFARINITQHNSSIVNPLIIFHISHCGRLGILGNLTISDQVIFPQYVCLPNQVYCLPECNIGAYCDGNIDCPDSKLDESPSCPKCLYKNLKLSANHEYLNEGENLILFCEFKKGCESIQQRIHWRLPNELKEYENSFTGQQTVNTLPRNLLVSGSYQCQLEDDSVEKNITICRKPSVMINNINPDADLVLITELEGSNIDLWCNTTEGHAQWIAVDSNYGKIFQPDKMHSRVSLRNLAGITNIMCKVRWGYNERGQILKSVRLNVVCDSKKQFSCTKHSGKMCIPLEHRCDSIVQCDDGSDEIGCNYCTEKSLNVDIGQNVVKDVGDTLIMACSASQETCYPLKWLRNNKALENSEHLIVYKQSVFFFNMSSEYAGIYRCTGSSNKGHIDVSIIVNTPPQLQLTPSISEINATFGKSQDIECIIRETRNFNVPSLRPQWVLKNHKHIMDNVKITYDENNKSTLSISKMTKENEGEYQCEVLWGSNSDRKSTVMVKINVFPLICSDGQKMCADKLLCVSESQWCDGFKQCLDGSDEDKCNKCQNGFVFVQPSNLVLLSKESAQITCYYHKDCYPVEWRVQHNRIQLGSIDGVHIRDNNLMLDKVGPKASNVYECFSGDKVSQSNVTVINEVEITFINNPSYMFVDYGSDIEVNCQSNYGEPHWLHRDFTSIDEISGASQKFIQPNIARLTIKSASYDARGYYNCSVRMSGTNKEVAKKLMYIHVYDLECPYNHIKCDHNTTCVPKHKVCDNVQHCKDNEDEKNCSKCRYDLEVRPKNLLMSTAGWSTFHCIVPHKDCLPVEWQGRNGERLSHKSFFAFNESLFIFNSEPRENDEIICTNGKKSASGFLTVKALDLVIEPTIPDDSILFIKKGETKFISCKSNLGTPQWIFPKEEMFTNLGIEKYKGPSGSAVIQLNDIKESASGVYICSISFSKEIKKKSIAIKVI